MLIYAIGDAKCLLNLHPILLLVITLCIFTAFAAATPQTDEPSSKSIILENKYLSISFATGNGAITNLVDKNGGINLAAKPDLADIFRLQIILADKTERTIFGRKQQLPHRLGFIFLTTRMKLLRAMEFDMLVVPVVVLRWNQYAK